MPGPDRSLKYSTVLVAEIKRKKLIWELLIIALVLSFIVPFCENEINLSKNHHVIGAIGSLLANISFGYIAGVIFYIFSDLLPKTETKYKVDTFILKFLNDKFKGSMDSALNNAAYGYRDNREAYIIALANKLISYSENGTIINSLDDFNKEDVAFLDLLSCQNFKYLLNYLKDEGYEFVMANADVLDVKLRYSLLSFGKVDDYFNWATKSDKESGYPIISFENLRNVLTKLANIKFYIDNKIQEIMNGK